MNEMFTLTRDWLTSTGEIGRFTGNIVRDVWGLRVFRFFGESLRQSGILIISSTLVIWALVFIIGLGTCGIEGAYFTEAQGAPAYAGVFTAWVEWTLIGLDEHWRDQIKVVWRKRSTDAK